MDSQKYSEEKGFVPRMTKQMIRKEKGNVQTSFETWKKTAGSQQLLKNTECLYG